MRILMFGKTGQVARAVQRSADLRDDVHVTALDRTQADLTDGAACAARVTQHAPQVDAVVIAAAYTAVDRAEAEPEVAQQVNGTTPGLIAEACAQADLPLMHLSTDYVFDGSGTAPWRPGDTTGPINHYGRSKREGEVRILAAGGRAVILRTSWVFSPDGANFVKSMLRLAQTRDQLSVVSDQIGGPTPADAIADAVLTIATALHRQTASGGIYHFSGTPDVSWADFARAIFAAAGTATQVDDIPTAQYPTPAPRPLNSRLECGALETDFGVERPSWATGLDRVLAANTTDPA
ncbi:dTDP-4-dehydrorhamnose reductase [Thalassorhabdomicrobium marinisediminis]|uniref:dTDP-4-dehydrorhamnose reductase n=1 Tax=Thalassorhabdomicrobium marinisediminis TaxID=2170577 RepID=UPI002491E38C|nr:dTDP-4-dehydrorhamnose reductase [Thalassorhabdomicrobium marinisediminis]